MTGGPRRNPRYTGRQLVLLKEARGGGGEAKALRNAAGLRIALSSDYPSTVPGYDLAEGDGLLFDRLGAVLLCGDPDQNKAIARQAARESLLVEPERYVRAMDASRPRTTPASRLTAPAFSDSRAGTWGLQATGTLPSGYGGRGVRVAVLDTGLDPDHPDFAGRRIASRSFVPRLPVADANGHGTRCAGVACGPREPCEGPRYGVAFGAEICIAKVLDDEANGVDGSVLAGIEWALGKGCSVISISLGCPVTAGEGCSRVYERIAARALASGSLLIAPAGNASQRPDRIVPVEHPANCPSILAVGAVDQKLELAPFSNGGRSAGERDVDLTAPGVAVVCSRPRPNFCDVASGTSIAAPFVAGIAALFAESRPEVRGAVLRELLLEACRPLSASRSAAGARLVQAPA